MNSDPYDSAAWKTFGMLDADENAMFDDAMRNDPALRKYSSEMDRISAAVAASTSAPIQPTAGELENIQRRLKLGTSKRAVNWLALTGWAAAAVMAVIFIVGRRDTADASRSELQTPPRESGPAAASSDDRTAPVVAKRLTQEIEVLRKNLEDFQNRDRMLFAALPGRAVPIVMAMNPPGVPASDFPITTVLGDALKTTLSRHEESADEEIADLPDAPPALPSAMPIYDSARDSGTLVVSNLPDPGDSEIYNLWVITELGGKPIYVGSLPESSADGAVSFDFSLGSTMIMPSGFILTIDPRNAAASPSEENIILQGPPPVAR